MPQIDFSKTLYDLKGNPIKESAEPGAKDTTLGFVCVTALLSSYNDEELSGAQKAGRFSLALKLYSGSVCDLKVEDVSMMKNLIGKAYGPLIVGRAYEILDPT